MKKDLTTGNIIKTMLIFAGPMIIGNLLQQFYNIADTLIVGRFVGADAMASVGAAYTLMTFLTSILIGLCMGSGSLVSFYFGKQDKEKMEVCVGIFSADRGSYGSHKCSGVCIYKSDFTDTADTGRNIRDVT